MSESPKDKQGVKDRIRQAIASIIALTVLVSLWVADALVQFMLLTRSNERRIRPTERVAWPKGLKQQLMRQQDNTCVYCGYRRAASSLDIDHIIPVVRGGGNQIDNLQVICRPCNQRKGLQTDQEFRARLLPTCPAYALKATISTHIAERVQGRNSTHNPGRQRPTVQADALHFQA